MTVTLLYSSSWDSWLSFIALLPMVLRSGTENSASVDSMLVSLLRRISSWLVVEFIKLNFTIFYFDGFMLFAVGMKALLLLFAKPYKS